ncbi:MAG: zf-TFIIB domain-containing protein [Armatimonadetes bacterium]|nr:zf-TFIIB domain-containing protein [Armatimonadota bacterium]
MPDPLNCPACTTTPMICLTDPASGLELDSCPQCFGIWFDGRELSRFFSSKALFTRLLNERQAVPVRPSKPPGPRTCPRCHQVMELAGAAGVELDLCRRCSGIWFDHGELSHLIESSRHGLLGSPEIVQQVGLGLALQAMEGLQSRQRQGLEALFSVFGAV